LAATGRRGGCHRADRRSLTILGSLDRGRRRRRPRDARPQQRVSSPRHRGRRHTARLHPTRLRRRLLDGCLVPNPRPALHLRGGDYFRNDYTEALGKSFGIVVTGEQVYEGVEFVRTRRHLWVERGSVHFVDGSAFSGVKLRPGETLDLAWVSLRPAKVHERPQGRVIQRLSRHSVVHIEAIKGVWAKLARGGWVKTAELARPSEWSRLKVSAPPTAGSTSTSSNKSSSPTRERSRCSRPWFQPARTPSNLKPRSASFRSGSSSPTPTWTTSNAPTSPFWHNDFGHRRSHGCINLSPQDARYLFQFTQPILPPGWNAILPIAEDHPTTVQVR